MFARILTVVLLIFTSVFFESVGKSQVSIGPPPTTPIYTNGTAVGIGTFNGAAYPEVNWGGTTVTLATSSDASNNIEGWINSTSVGATRNVLNLAGVTGTHNSATIIGTIAIQSAGTTENTGRLIFATANGSHATGRWTINPTGEFQKVLSDTFTGTKFDAPSDGIFQFTNSAGTGFSGLILGTNDADGIRLVNNSGALRIRDGQDSNYETVTALDYISVQDYSAPIGRAYKWTSGTNLNGNTNGFFSGSTANLSLKFEKNFASVPTISSGFGGTPSVTAGNNSNFRINVGTGGTADEGIIAFGTAWTVAPVCAASVETAALAEVRAHGLVATTSQLTIQASAAWVASSTLVVHCEGY